MKNLEEITEQAIALLKQLIGTPSFSGEEEGTASLLISWFRQHGIPCHRQRNNVWANNLYFDTSKPTLLLNSHHDTVRPNSGYSKNPFEPAVEEGRLFGLGSNDAGGALVGLLAAFTFLYDRKDLSYNLVFAGTAEEEINGRNGIASLWPDLPDIQVAIVGEPTQMDLAIAEKGLVVFDAKIKGTPSHAAHPNEDNAIYKLPETLRWFQEKKFEKSSEFLGDVKLTVTQIQAGSGHNVVPGSVDLVIDVRVNDRYTNQEIEKILKEQAPVSEIKARSLRLNASAISPDHKLVLAGQALGMKTYGSPTLSDQALLECPSIKLGPGDSKRSHTADEFIYLHEITSGVEKYVGLLVSI